MDAEIPEAREMPPRIRRAAQLIAFLGVLQILSMIHFFFYNFGDQLTERGISLNEVGVTKAQVRGFSEDLVNYISHLHIAIAGYGMATGLVVALLAWFGIQCGMRWAWWAAVGAISVSSLVGIPAHFVYGIATVGHLGPPFVLLAVFAIAAAMSYPSSSALRPKRPSSTVETDARNSGAGGSRQV
jgi:hypothetical protein